MLRSVCSFVAAVVVATTMTACGGRSEPPAAPATTTRPAPGPQALSLGKTEVPLTVGRVRSPTGFEPAMTIAIGEPGWLSVHRYRDAFDVGQADPASDGPLVVVTVTLSPERGSAAALAAIRRRQPGARTTSGPARLAGQAARRLDVTRGDGPVYTSRDGTVALDAGGAATLRFLAADTDAGTLVVAVLVPAGRHKAQRMAAAQAVVDSLRLV